MRAIRALRGTYTPLDKDREAAERPLPGPGKRDEFSPGMARVVRMFIDRGGPSGLLLRMHHNWKKAGEAAGLFYRRKGTIWQNANALS
jgi:hypothetical protein